MGLRIAGTGAAFGVDITDEAGRSVLRELAAQRLRVVIDNEGARLELDQSVTYDFDVPGEVKAYLPCPETGQIREVESITYKDGGILRFPRDFSAAASAQSLDEAGPKLAAGSVQDAG